MQHYTSTSTEMRSTEGAFRPLADLGAKIEQIEASLQAQLAAEGMPEEIEFISGAASLDGKLALVTADTDATDEVEHSAEDAPEDDTYSPQHFGQEQPGPTPEDHRLLERLKGLGWAAHPALLEQAGVSTERLAKLSSLGLAHMRATSSATGDRVFAMAGATDGDVERASEWVAAQRREARHSAMQSRAHQISRAITTRLGALAWPARRRGSTARCWAAIPARP